MYNERNCAETAGGPLSRDEKHARARQEWKWGVGIDTASHE